MLTLMTMSFPCIKMPWPPVASRIKPTFNNRAHNTTFTTPLPQCGLSSFPLCQWFTLHKPLSKNCILSLFNSQDVLPLLFTHQTPAKSSRMPPNTIFSMKPFSQTVALSFLSSQHVFHPCILYIAFLLPSFHVCLLNSTINYLEAGAILSPNLYMQPSR